MIPMLFVRISVKAPVVPLYSIGMYVLIAMVLRYALMLRLLSLVVPFPAEFASVFQANILS